MFHIAIRSLLLLILTIAATAAHAAQDCGFLPTSEVDRAFAEFAPWHTFVGGAVGNCTFLSDESAPPNMLSFIQQFKVSKADADDVYKAMRQGFADNHTITNVAGFGDRAFRYNSGGDNPGYQSIVAQKGKLVVTVSLNLQREVTDADIRAAMKLGQFALRGADDPEMARKASTCPWLNESGLKKLFGGKPYEVQVHGGNSCMASDKQQRVLLVSAIEMPDGFSPDMLRDRGCQQSRDLPEIDKEAKLSFACKGGNPRASVDFVVNGLAIKLTWVPASGEPSDAEKTALVELAKYARSAEAAR